MSVKQISVFGVAWLLTAISLSGATDAPLSDAAEIMDGKSIRALLQQCEGRPDRRFLVAVTNLNIGNGCKPPSRIDTKTHQLEQRLIRPFVRQQHQ